MLYGTLIVEGEGALDVIGLDAADIVRLGRVENLHERFKALLKLPTDGRFLSLLSGSLRRPLVLVRYLHLTTGALLLGPLSTGTSSTRASSFTFRKETANQLRALEQLDDLVFHLVSVLLDKSRNRVGDNVRKVLYNKRALPAKLGLLEDLAVLGQKTAVQLAAPVVVISSWNFAFLVKERKDANGLCLNEVNDRLVVVEGNKRPVDALADVLLLLELKDVQVKLLLEDFICVVDAKLLEGVGLKVLKAIDVEDADELVIWLNKIRLILKNPITSKTYQSMLQVAQG